MDTSSTSYRTPAAVVRHRGITLFEVTVAAGMLAVLMATSVQMLRVVSDQQRAAARRVVALQTVQALAEQLGNMPWDQLTASTLPTTVPAQVETYLPGAKLTVTVADQPESTASKRVSMTLTWSGPNGQPAGPVRLTTWVFPDQLQPTE